MEKALKLLSGLIIILLLSFLISVFILGSSGVSTLLGYDVHNISLKGAMHNYEFSLVDRFYIIAAVVILFVVFFAFVCFKTDSFIREVKHGYSFVKSYIIETCKLIMKSDVKYFLLLSLGTTIYLAYNYPLTLDEPQTYFDFIKPPFWHAIAFYPYPNNHIFSSLLINITNEISCLDLLFRMRIPAILISLLTWVFAYRFVRKFYTENLALFVVAIGTVVVTNVQHAYIARGYAFVMFFVVIGIYAAFNIIKNGNRKRDWLAFALSSALGAWTMPSYLYPFLSISIFIFIYNYKHLKTQILYSALVGILVFMFYSPILVVTGVEAISNNQFVEPIDRLTVIKSLPAFMLGTVVHIFYTPYYILLPFFVLVALYVLWKRDKNTIVLWLVFGLTPCLFLAIHSVLPFFRTFFYYGFIFVFLIAVTFKDLIAKVSRKVLTPTLLIIHILGIIYFVKISRDLMPEVFQSNDVIEEVLEDNKKYYLQDRISWIQLMNLIFEGERHNYDIEAVGGSKSDATDLLEYYDYCLIETSKDATTEMLPSKEMTAVFNTPIHVYKKE